MKRRTFLQLIGLAAPAAAAAPAVARLPAPAAPIVEPAPIDRSAPIAPPIERPAYRPRPHVNYAAKSITDICFANVMPNCTAYCPVRIWSGPWACETLWLDLGGKRFSCADLESIEVFDRYRCCTLIRTTGEMARAMQAVHGLGARKRIIRLPVAELGERIEPLVLEYWDALELRVQIGPRAIAPTLRLHVEHYRGWYA